MSRSVDFRRDAASIATVHPPDPVRWAAIAGLAAFYFVAVYVFARFNPLLLLGAFAYATAMAGAGYALALGRGSRSKTTTVLALAALAALPMVAGGRESHPSWVEIAGSMVPPVVLAGAGLGTVLAAAAVLVSRRHLRAPHTALPPLRPPLVGLFATLGILAQMLRDLGLLDARLLIIALLVGVGAAAIPVGLQSNHLWVSLAGWATVAALPVLHLHPGYTAYFGFNGVGILFDLAGLWLTGIAGAIAAIGIALHRRRLD
jgi:hypothetical protein